MKIDISFIDSERETAEFLLSQLIQAAAPMRFRVRKTKRDDRYHTYLSTSEACPIRPKML